jgi:hypothetical protein
MALKAHHILLRGGFQGLSAIGAVRIVAVGTLDQSLVHLVMEGHGELRLDLHVALEAKLGLSRLQHMIRGWTRLGTCMNAVAAQAAHIALAVRRAQIVGVRALVAAQAHGVQIFGRGLSRAEYLGRVATIRVRFASAMATFASDSGVTVLLGQLGVSVGAKPPGLFIVARCAGLAAHKIRG